MLSQPPLRFTAVCDCPAYHSLPRRDLLPMKLAGPALGVLAPASLSATDDARVAGVHILTRADITGT